MHMSLKMMEKTQQLQNVRKIIVVTVLLVMTTISWFSILDTSATKLIDEGFKRALVSFASARALNAAISAVQGTEVVVHLGVGVTLAPGQLLDPVNDLVETFSNLMMAACVAFGMQKFLINIGGHWFISLLLTVSSIAWAWTYLRQQQHFLWLPKLLAVLLMIRFAIPIIAIGTDFLFKTYLKAEYTVNQQAISQAPSQVTMFKSSSTAKIENSDWWEMAKNRVQALVSESKEILDLETRFKKLEQLAENWTEHIVNLMVIFLLQTMVIPVLLIWILYLMLKEVCYRAFMKI